MTLYFNFYFMADSSIIYQFLFMRSNFTPLNIFLGLIQNHVILSHVWMYHQGNDKTPISFVISKHIINSYSNWTIKIRYILVDTKVVLILCALPICQTRRRVKNTDNANHYPYKWCVSLFVCLLMENKK